jgi:hypothetical protein
LNGEPILRWQEFLSCHLFFIEVIDRLVKYPLTDIGIELFGEDLRKVPKKWKGGSFEEPPLIIWPRSPPPRGTA